MAVTVKGLNELVSKLENLVSARTLTTLEKKALEPTAQRLKEDIKAIAPVSTERNVHAVNYIDFEWTKKKYEIGLSSKTDFEISKSLWFQNYACSYRTTHYHWFDNFIGQNKEKYLEQAREDLRRALQEKLDSLK